METALYRIVQEALTNTARHAQARRVSIMLKEGETEIEGIISDDGIGFDIEALRKSPDNERGLGLAGMTERAVLLDGSLDIESRPGHGTTITVHIPRYSTGQLRALAPVESGEAIYHSGQD